MAAAMIHYKVTADEIRGKLFLDAGPRHEDHLRQTGPRGHHSRQRAGQLHDRQDHREQDRAWCRVDPWVSATGINENDNVAMNAAVGAVRAVWRRHRLRGVSGPPHTQGQWDRGRRCKFSIRGAGSLLGAARAARVINRVSHGGRAQAGRVRDRGARNFPCRRRQGKHGTAGSEGGIPPDGGACSYPTENMLAWPPSSAMPDLFDGISAKGRDGGAA